MQMAQIVVLDISPHPEERAPRQKNSLRVKRGDGDKPGSARL